MATKTYQLTSQEKRLTYEVRYGNRTTFEVSVHPDLSVVVRAPKQATLAQIRTFVNSRSQWIMRHWQHYSCFPSIPEVRFIDGEQHVYLGDYFQLRRAIGSPQGVILNRSSSTLGLIHRVAANEEQLAGILQRWYRSEAEAVFTQRLQRHWWPKVRAWGIEQPTLQVRKMKRRWGSCYPNGRRIVLNVALIKVPMACIDLVLAHELCHFKAYHHNRKFYAWLEKLLPNWQKHQQVLDQWAAVLGH